MLLGLLLLLLLIGLLMPADTRPQRQCHQKVNPKLRDQAPPCLFKIHVLSHTFVVAY
jgi:hypothetical protein